MESDAKPATMNSPTDATIGSLAPRWLSLMDEQAEKLRAEGTEIDYFHRKLLCKLSRIFLLSKRTTLTIAGI